MNVEQDAKRWNFMLRSMKEDTLEHIVAKEVQERPKHDVEMTPENMTIFVDDCIEELKHQSLTPGEPNETE